MKVVHAALQPEAGTLSSLLIVADGATAGISLAAAGDMAFSRRDTHPQRQRLLAALRIPRDTVYGLRQVHSRTVVDADGRPEEVARLEADGMITDRRDAWLTVTVADCLPIFIVDRRLGALSLVHSGWKGTGIVIDALRRMAARFDTRASDVAVTIGPGIGPCCYRVPGERAELFASTFGAAARVHDGDRVPALDLRVANLGLLEREGVAEATVYDDCTCCSLALGSFRRQGPEGYTLMLAWIGRGAES